VAQISSISGESNEILCLPSSALLDVIHPDSPGALEEDVLQCSLVSPKHPSFLVLVVAQAISCSALLMLSIQIHLGCPCFWLPSTVPWWMMLTSVPLSLVMWPNHPSFLFLVVAQAIKLHSPVDVIHPDTPWMSLLLAALYSALEEGGFLGYGDVAKPSDISEFPLPCGSTCCKAIKSC
jgi:hypothetical protein